MLWHDKKHFSQLRIVPDTRMMQDRCLPSMSPHASRSFMLDFGDSRCVKHLFEMGIALVFYLKLTIPFASA